MFMIQCFVHVDHGVDFSSGASLRRIICVVLVGSVLVFFHRAIAGKLNGLVSGNPSAQCSCVKLVIFRRIIQFSIWLRDVLEGRIILSGCHSDKTEGYPRFRQVFRNHIVGILYKLLRGAVVVVSQRLDSIFIRAGILESRFCDLWADNFQRGIFLLCGLGLSAGGKQNGTKCQTDHHRYAVSFQHRNPSLFFL